MDRHHDVEKHETHFGSVGGAGTANAQGYEIKGIRGHLVYALGEFVGTTMFLWLAFAGNLMVVNQASNISTGNGSVSTSQAVIFVALAYGFSFLVTAWAFYRISGGLFNPAIALGMVIGGEMSVMRAAFIIPAQFLGAMAAAGLVECMFPGPIEAVNTYLGPTTSIVRGLFIEMFLTFMLVFVALMVVGEKTTRVHAAPVAVGLTLFVVTIAGFFFSGASVNPARSFGSSVAGPSFPGYHWIYWLGPVLGAAIAGAYFRANKMLHHDPVNVEHTGATNGNNHARA
jgi:aquaporin related protein